MTTKRSPIACPKCGRYEKVAYVEIRRTKSWYFGAAVVETDDTEKMSAGSYLSTGSEAGSEIIDSMGNDEGLECFDCGTRFDLPEVDDILVEAHRNHKRNEDVMKKIENLLGISSDWGWEKYLEVLEEEKEEEE